MVMSLLSKSGLQSPRLVLCILGIVAFSVTAASTVFNILDAVAFRNAHISFSGLPTAAAAFDIMALIALIVFLMYCTQKKEKGLRRSWWSRWTIPWSCTLIAAMAAVLTLVSLVSKRTRSGSLKRTASKASVSLLPAEFALWCLSVLSQISFYTTCFAIESLLGGAQDASPPQDGQIPGFSQQADTNRPVSLRIMTPPYAHGTELPSPTFSTASTHSLQSWRASLQQAVRPISSRTRLLKRRDSKSLYSDCRSIDNSSQPDGFDTWDTSSVDPQVLTQPESTYKTTLEPIPGSRPVSPARALDGPFPPSSPERPSTAPERPAPAFPESLSVPRPSRPTSPSTSEAHIHPLFRSDSPIPPPVATPGTTVIASPFSGQIISRPSSRMRSNSHVASRAPSPSPLLHQHSFDCERPRTPSSPAREMTPPIPDVILNASLPTSYAGYRNKKAVDTNSEADR